MDTMLLRCISRFLPLNYLKSYSVCNFLKTTILEDENYVRIYRNYVTNSMVKFSNSSSTSSSSSDDGASSIPKSEKNENFNELSSKLFKKRSQTKHFYIKHPNVAKKIIKHLKNFGLKQTDTILEVNPGPGILTRELLKTNVSKIILIEVLNDFMKSLKLIESSNPKRVKLKSGDFINLWKLVFKDKIDNGSRLADLLNHVPKRNFDDEPNMKVIATVSSLNFFKHLINSLIFDKSLYTYGRCEMYLLLSPVIFIHLTSNREVGYMLYRATTILFQIMFEYELLDKFPKEHFLPSPTNSTKLAKLIKNKNINEDNLYLFRIIPRRNLYELCPQEYKKSLWFFVKQNCISRKNRIIPNLEKWIPGCGIRIILNSNETEQCQRMFSDNFIELPKYSKPCVAMSTKNFHLKTDIFTEFGDLTPSQMLSLFTLFRSWPEYNTSSFLPSLENSLLKMMSSDVNEIDLTIDREQEINTIAHDKEITEPNPESISTEKMN